MSRQLVLIIIAALAVLALVTLGPAACRKWQGERAQSRVDRGQAEAGAMTGEVSLNTLEAATANAAETDRTVSEGAAAIHAAPEADKGRVAVQQACRLKANRNKPQCQGVAR